MHLNLPHKWNGDEISAYKCAVTMDTFWMQIGYWPGCVCHLWSLPLPTPQKIISPPTKLILPSCYLQHFRATTTSCTLFAAFQRLFAAFGSQMLPTYDLHHMYNMESVLGLRSTDLWHPPHTSKKDRNIKSCKIR